MGKYYCSIVFFIYLCFLSTYLVEENHWDYNLVGGRILSFGVEIKAKQTWLAHGSQLWSAQFDCRLLSKREVIYKITGMAKEINLRDKEPGPNIPKGTADVLLGWLARGWRFAIPKEVQVYGTVSLFISQFYMT